MIINDEYDFFFYHIPKCAGTTCRSELIRIGSDSGELWSGVEMHGMKYYKHTEIRFLPPITQEHVFTVVRNPWERFHSLYWDCRNRLRHLKSGNETLKKWYWKMHLQSRLPFPEWIMTAEYIHPSEYLYNTNPLNTLNKSQMYYIEGQDNIKFFRLEELSKLDDYLYELTGKKTSIATLKLNNSKRPYHYRDQFDNESREKVAEIAAPEIEKFGYEF